MVGIRWYVEGVLVSGPAYGMQGALEKPGLFAFAVPLRRAALTR